MDIKNDGQAFQCENELFTVKCFNSMDLFFPCFTSGCGHSLIKDFFLKTALRRRYVLSVYNKIFSTPTGIRALVSVNELISFLRDIVS